MKISRQVARLALALGAVVSLAQGSHAQEKVEQWYTVTVLPRTPYAFYRETLEYPKGRVHIKTEMWKQEEGYINEEQLGAFALDNDLLTPLFFNFHSVYRANELTIDGTAAEARLTVRIKKNGQDAPVMTRSVPAKTIFSSTFPLFLKKNHFRKEKSGSFHAVLEDNEPLGFAPVVGSFKVTQPDEFASSSKTTRYEVDFSNNKSYWYLDSNGNVARIDMPAQKTLVERTTEAKARAFLSGGARQSETREQKEK